jgi:pyruvate dehydrogenase E1 component alpha subunit
METTSAPLPVAQAELPVADRPTDPADVPVLREAYRQMLLIRRVEEAAAKAYGQGKIGGFLHLAIGQESVCVGAALSLRPTDYMVGSYREHGHFMAKAGVTLDAAKAVLSELLAKDTGCSKGMGGSMHMFSAAHRFLGGYGIVGAQTPLAAGVAFASKYRNLDEVTLCFLGDGAVNQGAFFEGLSLAGLWKLPVVFIVENNQYSMGTPLERTLADKDITLRAAGFAMERDRFSADDVLEVRDRISAAVHRARTGGVPSLIEIETYRYRGHSMSDPGNYRTKEEIEQWKKRDAIELARKRLLRVLPEAELSAIDAQVRSDVTEAVQFAEQAPPAQEASLWSTVYAEPGTDPRKF